MASSFLKSPRLSIAYSKARKAIRLIDFDSHSNLSFRQIQAKLVASHLKSSLTIEDVEKLIDKKLYRVWEKSFHHLTPCHGVAELLQLLKERGVKLGVLSDFPIQKKLRYMGFSSGLFAVKLCAEDFNRLKPHEASFKALADECGYSPHEILYVGNSYEKDIEGAKKAGMITAHFTRKKVKQSISDITFRSYYDLAKKLRKLIID